jgi:hypothetical protein
LLERESAAVELHRRVLRSPVGEAAQSARSRRRVALGVAGRAALGAAATEEHAVPRRRGGGDGLRRRTRPGVKSNFFEV